ncbi:two pore domain potassium channel family protein [cyanobacterium endosymbiont of Rhopalodia gibberula]|uniref:two pore domain potassium channel family protein n=1 Tax=cyanobacterium endosymbiont of Rhopalodia gibberula TaxID=1763363 RepID=UPI001E4DB584|nr:two pore domain potassium channel family protein [cyanobacterium endosymbiont of Rhopalodia gibberula]
MRQPLKSITVTKPQLTRNSANVHLFSKQKPPSKSMEDWKQVESLLDKRTRTDNTFIRDFVSYLSLSTLFILLGLLVGIIGYHWTAHLSWIDAMVEASMILSGMGPVSPLSTNSAKFFASLYALFSGLIFVLAMGVVLSPLVYSLLKQLRLNKPD